MSNIDINDVVEIITLDDVNDEEPVGLLFTAEAVEPDGQTVAFVNVVPRPDGTT